MKNIILAVITLLFISNCTQEQTEQTVQENIVLNAMTNGQWKVTSFVRGGTDVTADFAVYKFQFKKDLTVDAVLVSNNNVERSGSWNADAIAKTITSSFGNVSTPLVWLNGTWAITKNSFTYVESTQTVNGEVRTMRLDKI